MAILMGGVMAIIMLSFMLAMYSSKAINAAIFIGATVAVAGSLWLVRSQTTVGDTSYMRAMIPHHSIAIMTSGRANIEDTRVRKLADGIIFAQDKEIAEMRYLINDIEASGVTTDESGDSPTQIVSLEEALSTAKVARVDAEFLKDEEIKQLFPDGAACTFNYTTKSPASLAIGNVDGARVALVKLSGDLVRLDADAEGQTFMTDGATMQLNAADGSSSLENVAETPVDATLLLELDAGLSAGYRGFYSCKS
ncbi:DUF305 domain-containing protein [Roseovarius sp. S4756]